LTGGGNWSWNDGAVCPSVIGAKARNAPDLTRSVGRSSALWCYFGHHESGLRCPEGSLNWYGERRAIASWKHATCEGYLRQYTKKEVSTAVVEWLFQNVSRIVIEDAERQIEEAFPVNANETSASLGIRTRTNQQFRRWPGLPPSKSLVTVHVRWGDKAREMQLTTMDEIIDGTKKLLTEDELAGTDDVHVYVVTEDPRALKAFQEESPPNWIVHSSGPKIGISADRNVDLNAKMTALQAYRNNMDMMSLGGKAGLESLAGLLIAMQANRYVLQTQSNWSRLIDELRRNVVDLRCDGCTRMIDLRPRDWGKWR